MSATETTQKKIIRETSEFISSECMAWEFAKITNARNTNSHIREKRIM